jgi:hypothetical protein
MRLAKENRYELKRFNLQKEMNQLDIVYFRDQARPQVNFVANYTLNGVGGTSAPPRGNCNPVNIDGTPTCLSVDVGPNPDGTFSPIVTRTDFVLTPPVASNFVGGYGTALRNLFSNDFRSWSVGIEINLPLRNRVAKANLARARETEKQTELLIRQQLQNIEVEVRNAVQAVDTARLRIQSTSQQRVYAEQQLEAENKKLQAGLGSVFLVLTRQTDLSNAQVAENSAKADYAREVANLQRVLSTTLTSNNIEIPDPKAPIK